MQYLHLTRAKFVRYKFVFLKLLHKVHLFHIFSSVVPTIYVKCSYIVNVIAYYYRLQGSNNIIL